MEEAKPQKPAPAPGNPVHAHPGAQKPVVVPPAALAPFPAHPAQPAKPLAQLPPLVPSVPAPPAAQPAPVKPPSVITPSTFMSEPSLEAQSFVARCRSIIVEPEKFFSSLTAPPKTSLIHFFVVSAILLILPFLVSVVSLVTGASNQYLVLIALIAAPFISLIGVGIQSVILHALVRIFGGAGTLRTTFKIVLYLSTFSLFFVVPVLNLVLLPFTLLYVPYATAVAFSKAHKLSMQRVYVVLALAFFVLALLSMLVAFMVASLLFSYLSQLLASPVSGMLPPSLLLGLIGASQS